MRIAIDAGALCVKEKRLRVGVFTLLRSLVSGLARARPKDTIRLYVFDAIDEDIASKFPKNVKVRMLPRFLFSKMQMTLSLFFDPCDIFLGTGQYVPLGTKRVIGWIYDLGFLNHPEFYPESVNQLLSITKTVVSRSESIITISEHVKNQIVKYFHVDPGRIYVCYPGIEAMRKKIQKFNNNLDTYASRVSEKFSPRGSNDREFEIRSYFLFVGAFKPGKNIPFLLRAYSKAVKRGLTSDLLLVGSDRWMSEDLQGIIAREKLDSRVQIKGFVDEDTLKKLYRGANATLIPSLVEGFGFPVVESFQAGTPVIGSNTGSLPEVIGEAGICIDPTDEEGYARALLQFEKKEVREKYVKKIQSQLEKFTREKFVERVSEVIDCVYPR